jgi:hypothetical protein
LAATNIGGDKILVATKTSAASKQYWRLQNIGTYKMLALTKLVR